MATALSAALVATGLGLTSAAPAAAQSTPSFSDLGGTIHAEAIGLIAAEGITTGYPDGTFRPREDVRRDQMATFLTNALGLQRQNPSFSDVPSDSPHYQAVGALDAAGISRGFPDGTYRPRNLVTRGQMASFLTQALDLDAGTGSFSDVPAGYVHADAIAALAASGITAGFPDGTYRPNDPVKRDQMAAFLVRGLGLTTCPPAVPQASTLSAESDEGAAANTAEAQDAEALVDRGSEDLEELSGTLSEAAGEAEAEASAMAISDIGPGVPPAFSVTSAIRAGDALEIHSFGLSTSRSVRAPDGTGNITANTQGAAGQRTWATAAVGNNVFVGQWGAGDGPNLWRYSTSSTGNRTATAVATVPSGNEFWSLAADGSGRLWAGTRAHAGGAFRETIGLSTRGDRDPRHVVHRIDRASGRVTNVLFAAPCMPTLDTGMRPDVKQVAASGETLYVGLGQQTGGARLYAFEPGNRSELLQRDVRHLTPDSVASATGIFAMRAAGDLVALGTQGTPARMVVLDGRTGDVRVDVALTNEDRVDAVAIQGNRVAAAGQSGRVYTATIPTVDRPTGRQATTIDGLLPAGQFNRYIEFANTAGTSLRGVSNQGITWTRSPAGNVTRTDLTDRGVGDLAEPGQPHSLHVGAATIAVGGNGAVGTRQLANVGALRRAYVAGEAKAVTSGASGTTFAALYPSATLVQIAANGQDVTQRAEWAEAFTRPADAAYDARSSRVQVIARDDNNPQQTPIRPGGPTVQFRASHLFPLSANGNSNGQQLAGYALTRPTSDTTNEPIEASAIAVPEGSIADVADTTVFVGDTFGGIQAVNSSNGRRVGTGTGLYRVLGGNTPRAVVDVDVVGDRVVVTTSGPPVGTSNESLAVVHELDAVTLEATRDAITLPTSFPEVGDAASSGSATVLTRGDRLVHVDRTTGIVTPTPFEGPYTRSDTFGGPYVELGGDCDAYGFAGRNLFRSDRDACSLLP